MYKYLIFWRLECERIFLHLEIAVLSFQTVVSPPRKRNGRTSLHSSDWLCRRHSADAFLDGRNPRLPEAAELRARVLLPVPCAFLLLRRLAPGAERQNPLRRA